MESQKKNKTYEKRYTNVRLTVSLRPVLFPVDFNDLIKVLKDKQYTAKVDLPPSGIGRRIGGGGMLATRGNVSVVADSERRYIGIDGKSVSDVKKAFDEIIKLLSDELWVDVDADSAYYEMITRISILSKQSPVDSINLSLRGVKGLDVFGKLLKEDVGLFTIRIAPKGKLPNEDEWFDIRIEADVARPKNTYNVEIVYRKNKYDRVMDFASNLDMIIDSILNTVEQGG